MNVRFGKKTSAYLYDYAPNALEIGGDYVMNPTDEMYLSAGYKYIVDKTPEERPGYIAVKERLEETDDTIKVVYRYVEKPREYRKFSRPYLKIALAKAGLLPLVKQFLESKSVVEGYDLWQMFNDCSCIEESFDGFDKYRDLLLEYLRDEGVTVSDDQVEAILNASIYRD